MKSIAGAALAGIFIATLAGTALAQTAGSGAGSAAQPGSGQNVIEESGTIQQVQEQLKAAGFSPGPVNGIMNEDTRTALRQFQRSKGLVETGQLDQETRSALLSGSSGTAPPGTK